MGKTLQYCNTNHVTGTFGGDGEIKFSFISKPCHRTCHFWSDDDRQTLELPWVPRVPPRLSPESPQVERKRDGSLAALGDSGVGVYGTLEGSLVTTTCTSTPCCTAGVDRPPPSAGGSDEAASVRPRHQGATRQSYPSEMSLDQRTRLEHVGTRRGTRSCHCAFFHS